MRLFVAEFPPVVARKVLMGEFVKEENGMIVLKNLLMASEIQAPGGKMAWGLFHDPNWSSEAEATLDKSHFALTKFADPMSDQDLIKQYEHTMREVRLARSNLVVPK